MQKGDQIYHKKRGALTVSDKRYSKKGNRTIWYANDEKGTSHELDGTEVPMDEVEDKEANKNDVDELVALLGVQKGDPGNDADEERIISSVLSKIQLPENGAPGENADNELIVRELLPLVMDQMPRPEKINEVAIISKILSRINIPRNGKDGENGSDGSPDEPKEIVTKLESLTGDDRLDARSIKNLPKSQTGGGGSYTGLAKIDTLGTPGTLQEKIIAGANVTVTKTGDTLVIAGSAGGGGGSGDALVANPLSQFAATTSAQLAGVISDETGSGALVFGTSPAITTPTGIVKGDVGLGSVDNTTDAGKPVSTAQQTALNLKANLASPTFTGTVVLPSGQALIAPALGTPASGVMTNVTGTASGLTAGNVTTNANLTGPVTSVGNATAIADAALSIAKTSGLQAALDAKQPLDAQLTDLAGLAYASNSLKVVRVNAGETAFELATIGSGSGITRAVAVTSGSITMGSTASTDYVYFVAGAHTLSLAAASGNTNRYTIKNNHSAAITIDTVGAETIDGSASIQVAPEDSVDIISDGTNFFVI